MAPLFVVGLLFWAGAFGQQAAASTPVKVVPASPIDSCPQLPLHNATTIYDLRPTDIRVVMALGDSITAGFGVMGRDVPDILDEYRGLSGPIGGDDGAITMANFFRHFRPDVIGASVGRHLVELPEFPYYDQDKLNGAQSNAGVASLMYQLEHLISRLNSDPRIDMEKDWKFINLLIGANDACPLCINPFPPSIPSMGDFYEQNLRQVVETAYKKIPRLFFNILPMFNVSQVYWLSLGLTYCADFHDVLPIECLCAFDSDSWRRNYLDQVLQEFNKRIYKLYDEWKAKKLTTFALQIQPFSANLTIPSLQYLSTLDCFHPSLLAHQQLAVATWNSLITPWNKKARSFEPNPTLLCPDASSRLYVD